MKNLIVAALVFILVMAAWSMSINKRHEARVEAQPKPNVFDQFDPPTVSAPAPSVAAKTSAEWNEAMTAWEQINRGFMSDPANLTAMQRAIFLVDAKTAGRLKASDLIDIAARIAAKERGWVYPNEMTSGPTKLEPWSNYAPAPPPGFVLEGSAANQGRGGQIDFDPYKPVSGRSNVAAEAPQDDYFARAKAQRDAEYEQGQSQRKAARDAMHAQEDAATLGRATASPPNTVLNSRMELQHNTVEVAPGRVWDYSTGEYHNTTDVGGGVVIEDER